jgi:hypothetical protein|tara:strand:- start:799 stop:1272 length:474 start_codon:yes stop_codon:yes gene_type:complete
MNRFYRKPKPETMKKNRETARQQFPDEMSWLKENLGKLSQNQHKFLIEMYAILVSGSRKVTPKMASTIQSSIEKCKNNPNYNEELREEANEKLQPILGKINVVKAMAEAKDDYSVDFITDVERYVRANYRITKKQMEGLNKVYKRLTEDLFEGDKDE